MEKVGIRDLKNKLSSYIQNVKKGDSFIVTDRGVDVALIEPVDAIKYKELMLMVKEDQAEWSGHKPKFSGKTAIAKGEKTVSEIVMDDRR
ncbi:MAG: type II toxin-antitoxin system prevent-host-death family antitoxin [Candidatus Humimicrobiaceae bacterium]